MDGNIFLKEVSATNTIPQERLGRKLGAPVRLMLLARGTWPLYMTRPLHNIDMTRGNPFLYLTQGHYRRLSFTNISFRSSPAAVL